MDVLDRMAAEASERSRQRYAEMLDALEETDRRMIANQTAFAFLHASLRRFAAKLREGGVGAFVNSVGIRFDVHVPGRCVACSFSLEWTSIVVEYWGVPGMGFVREEWSAPAGAEIDAVMHSVSALVEKIAHHLTR